MGFNFKSKSSTPVRGGGGHMVGKQSAGPARPQKMTNQGGGGKFAVGGKGKMFGKQSAMPAKAC